ncbi:hypothetical protein GCM10008018_42300 [Paenibacillus marchantiophytorum]|uniref:DUF5071 domain-containing protein n=1 Tax=Paenibacillus marchantiophytorum TaxID=1619310 RepID=A0ABQ1EX90_9BACL|nr:DUF5071 domain-containing protein [Paenibacillus marchantiophytorum]GFZ91571.1 hypothetical protein GCM10008018_42300 [Paenibacillus marchantiophytorum]
MENKITELLAALNWHRSQEDQDLAVQELIKYKDEIIHNLISETSKEQWLNVIRIIDKLDISYQINAVPQMLLLLADLNWPGALPAVEIMKRLEIDSIKYYIEDTLRRADKENDTIWIAWIKYLIEEMNVASDFHEYKYILKKAEW